jgi:hypothetical protein
MSGGEKVVLLTARGNRGGSSNWHGVMKDGMAAYYAVAIIRQHQALSDVAAIGDQNDGGGVPTDWRRKF